MQIMLPFAMAGFVILLLANESIVLALGALLFVGFLGFMIRWPDMGTLVVLFAIYSNISVLAMRSPSSVS